MQGKLKHCSKLPLAVMLEMFKVNKNSNNNFQENMECFFFLNFLFINAFSNLFFL